MRTQGGRRGAFTTDPGMAVEFEGNASCTRAPKEKKQLIFF